MINYLDVIYGILGYLGKAIIVIGAYYIGRIINNYESDEDKIKKVKRLKWEKSISLLFILGIISAGLGATFGIHTENADPLYGGGETVVDFKTTKKQQYEYGLTMFIVLSIPALCGLYKSNKKDDNTKIL